MDTSTAIDLLRRRRREVRIRHRAALDGGEELALSTLALCELLHGAKRGLDVEAQTQAVQAFSRDLRVASFDPDDAGAAATLRNELERTGRSIDTPDLLIAAQARQRGWTVVTSNVRHFGRVQDLELIDWRVSDARLTPKQIAERLA